MQQGIEVVGYPWRIVYTKQAQKDANNLAVAGLKKKAQQLLDLLQKNPLQSPPPYKKLICDLNGSFSRRINIQHRLFYQVIEEEKVVKILRMWTHY